MPNAKTHKLVAAAAGGGGALYQAQGQKPIAVLLETLGGILGGISTSRLPDIIDPPLHPNHRSYGHGIIPVGTVGTYCLRNLGQWQEWLRNQAEIFAAAAKEAKSDLERIFFQAIESLCRLAAGFIAGAIAGYASHLALDALTPKGLPLIR